jgi:hypothetical protein
MFNVPESITTLADGGTVLQHRDLVELLLSQHAQPSGCAQVAVQLAEMHCSVQVAFKGFCVCVT